MTISFEVKFKDPKLRNWRTKNYVLAASALRAATDLDKRGWLVEVYSVTRLKLAYVRHSEAKNVRP